MLKKILAKLLRIISPKYQSYTPRIIKNYLKQIIHKKPEHKFLFILSPAYCGSTLLNQIISTSNSVSVNNNLGNREGQSLPSVKKIMFDHQRRWDVTLDFDWEMIKKEWLKYWDLTYPVLLEKSPPNIIRTKSIKKIFVPSYFIILYRNPYAHCESLIRRKGSDATSSAKFAIECLKYQKDNITQLENSLAISYEFLTTETKKAAKLLAEFMPELKDIHYNHEFTAHNFLSEKMKINNLNEIKISKLTTLQLKEINKVFAQESETLTFFNYQVIKSV